VIHLQPSAAPNLTAIRPQNYTLSISCKDQLLTGGSYSLQFGRLSLSAHSGHDTRPNPHTEAEPFLHALLRQGRLADALPALVSVLRNTVPVLEVLTRVIHPAPARAIPKAAGWWRVIFSPGSGGGGAQHALDFRVLTGSRVAMLDASQSVFRNAPREKEKEREKMEVAVGFRPIPGLARAVADAVAAGRGRGSVAGVDIGVVCGAADAVVVGEALWRSIAREQGMGEDVVVVKMEET
jgi:mediator of RNA polymerase II transcription subunit 14